MLWLCNIKFGAKPELKKTDNKDFEPWRKKRNQEKIGNRIQHIMAEQDKRDTKTNKKNRKDEKKKNKRETSNL